MEDDNLKEARLALSWLSISACVGFVVQARTPYCKHEMIHFKILACLFPEALICQQSSVPSSRLSPEVPIYQHCNVCFSNVIEEVGHVEPAAHILPAEARDLVAIQEADFIQRNLLSGSAPEPTEGILLIQLNRTPAALVTALLEGGALSSIRRDMQEESCNTRLESGTFIFVKPWQYQSAIEAAMETLHPRKLKSSHVIFAKSVEHLLEEAMNGILGDGVWAKYQQDLVSTPAMFTDISVSASSESNPSSYGVLIVKHTFICLVPQSRISDRAGPHTA